MKNYIPKVVAVLAIILCIASPQKPANASAGGSLPIYSDFINTIRDGEANVIRGVYVPDVMAFPIVQQPIGKPSAVSENDGEITQFGSAERNHVIGLLAHNTLAGAYFSGLRLGQEIRIIYGNTRVEYFIVNHLDRFKVVEPGSRNIGYMDLKTHKIFDTQELFARYYEGKFHVTFQTCIQMGDDTSWGRLFVTAIPVSSFYFRELKFMNLQSFKVTWL